MFTISGMTCHACESLITMDLEDAGLPAPESISAKDGAMTIQLEDNQVEATRQIVQSSGKYSVEAVEIV